MMLQSVVILLLIVTKPASPIINIHRTVSNKASGGNLVCTEEKQQNNNCQSATSEHTYGSTSKEHNDTVDSFPRSTAMLYSLASSGLVGLTGIFPLIMIPTADEVRKKDTKTLNRLLSFAVGGLLGDVFLHLLPESWNAPYSDHESFHSDALKNGLWVLFGLVFFCLLEKLFPDKEEVEEIPQIQQIEQQCVQNENGHYRNCNENNNVRSQSDQNGHENNNSTANGDAVRDQSRKITPTQVTQPNVKMSGYLNLLANCIDNFTHGLAIGGSYLVGRRVGIMTTIAILLHEIPHEIGDFAILLRAGFDRWKAAKYQIMTACGGLIGAIFAYISNSDKAGGQVAWILPFTSGGFIYIALCTVVPDIMKETTTPKESLIQLMLMISAIAIMGGVGLLE